MNVNTNMNVPIRPFNKGMIRNLPSQALPMGAVVSAGNYNVTTNGLRARGGFVPLYADKNTTVPTLNDLYNMVTGDVQDTFLLEQNDGQKELLTLTHKALYKMNRTNQTYERVPFGGSLDVTSAVQDGENINLSIPATTGEQFLMVTSGTERLFVKEGDYIVQNDIVGEILTITPPPSGGDPHIIGIKVDKISDWTSFSGTVRVELNFTALDQYKVDFALVNGIDQNTLVLAAKRDTALVVYSNTATELFPAPIDSTSTVDPQYDIKLNRAIATRWYRNRLWMANMIEDGKHHKQRLRWSDATSYLNQDSQNRFRPENYIDLSDSMGEILSIQPMGEILMIYCSDAVYYGRASNIAGLPYTFTKINTPGIGLVGQSAITPWIDGHYFVGQDDIYFMSAAQSLQPMGTSVLSITLDTCYNKAGIDVRPDPMNQRILFLFPENIGDDYNALNCSTKLHSFNYKTGGWSYLEAAYDDTITGKEYKYYFNSISSSMLYSGHSGWTELLQGEPEETATYDWIDFGDEYATWERIYDGQLTDHTLLFGLIRKLSAGGTPVTDLYVESEDHNKDLVTDRLIGDSISNELISADYDFDLPDDNKQFTRVTIKLENYVTENTTFVASVSSNRGRTYKPVGELRIRKNEDEGKINFRQKGSTFRFKLESIDFRPNTINEVVIRLSKRGKEI